MCLDWTVSGATGDDGVRQDVGDTAGDGVDDDGNPGKTLHGDGSEATGLLNKRYSQSYVMQ